jgi:hypothetical protein
VKTPGPRLLSEQLHELQGFWLRTRRRIAQGGGLTFTEIGALDVKAFFLLAGEVEAERERNVGGIRRN